MAAESTCPLVRAHRSLRAACIDCTGEPASGQRRLRRRAIVCLQGEPSDAIYAVVDGWLREVVTRDGDRLVSPRLLGPGAMFGWSALTGASAPTTVEVVRDATLCAVHPSVVRQWFVDHPEESLSALTALAEDVDVLRERNVLLNAPAEERVRTLVHELGQSNPPGAWTRLPLTRAEMGELLGLSLETVSRCMQKLAANGELEVRARWVRLKTESE